MTKSIIYSRQDVLVRIQTLTEERLDRWTHAGLVSPGATPENSFDETDLSRLELICELRDELEVEERTLPIILSLIDQLHGLRSQMDLLAGALRNQPTDVQKSLLDAID